MPAKHHYRRDVLRGLSGAVGFVGGLGAASSVMAGCEADDVGAGDFDSAFELARTPTFSSLANAEAAIKAGALVVDDFVDVLGHRSPGDGGGFRGTVLASSASLLPGEGMIEPVEGQIDVRMFGATDTPGDSTRTLQQALNWSSAQHQVVRLPQRFDVQEPLKVSQNAGLVGLGAGFRSGVRPVDCPAFLLDGELADGGWVFNILLRDFAIWGDRVGSRHPYAMKLHQCYRSAIENVTFRGYAVSGEQTASVIAITGKQNHVIFDRVAILGQTTGSGGCGIRIANAPDAGHVHFMHLDVEKTTSGIMMESGAGAQFLNPYFERLPTAIRIVPGIRSLVVQGGVFRVNNHNSPAIHFCEGTYNRGEHIAFMGIAFQRHKDNVVYPGIIGRNIIWDNSNPINLTGSDLSSITISDALLEASNL